MLFYLSLTYEKDPNIGQKMAHYVQIYFVPKTKM